MGWQSNRGEGIPQGKSGVRRDRSNRSSRTPAFIVSLLVLLVPLLLGSSARAALFSEDTMEITGRLREYISFNLQDQPETINYDDQGEISMLRTSLLIETRNDFRKYDLGRLTTRIRFDKEINTDYLQQLETARQDLPPFAAAPDLDFVDNEYDNAEIREIFWDLPITRNSKVRMGRQQVVWGRTDLFQTMDVINGFNFTWRNFLTEFENIRKPVWMVQFEHQFPRVGTLELLLRPGWDDEDQVTNDLDIFSGRWAPQGLRGQPIGNTPFNFGGLPYNYEHPDADPEDPSYGARWVSSFTINKVRYEYSLNYYHTLSPGFVINSSFDPYKGSIGGGSGNNTLFAPLPGLPTGVQAELINPEIDLMGFTVNRYFKPPFDLLGRMEVVFIPDHPYNVGSIASGQANCLTNSVVPAFTAIGQPPATAGGICGIVEKDTVKWSMSFDKSVYAAMDYLGADRQALLSVQIFDEWILDHRDSQEIVEAFPFSSLRDEHRFIATGVFQWNYANQNYNPYIKSAVNLSEGGGLFAPGIDIQFGTNMRLRIEADFFLEDEAVTTPVAPWATSANVHPPFDFFANADQLMTRWTYQF